MSIFVVFIIIAIVIVSVTIYLLLQPETVKQPPPKIRTLRDQYQTKKLVARTQHKIDKATIESAWASCSTPPNTQIEQITDEGICVRMIREQESEDDGSRVSFVWRDGYWSCALTPSHDRSPYPHLLQWCRVHATLTKLRNQLPVLTTGEQGLVIECRYGVLDVTYWHRLPTTNRELQKTLSALNNIHQHWVLPTSRDEAERWLIEQITDAKSTTALAEATDTIIMDCQNQLDEHMVIELQERLLHNPDKQWATSLLYDLFPHILTPALRAQAFAAVSQEERQTINNLMSDAKASDSGQLLTSLRRGLQTESLNKGWFDEPLILQHIMGYFLNPQEAERFGISVRYCAKLIARHGLMQQALTELQRATGHVAPDERLLWLMHEGHKDLPTPQAWVLWLRLLRHYKDESTVLVEVFQPIMRLPYMYQHGFFESLYRLGREASTGYIRSLWFQNLATLPQSQLEMLPLRRQDEYFKVLEHFTASEYMTEQYGNIFLLLASRTSSTLMVQAHTLAQRSCITQFCEFIFDRHVNQRLQWARAAMDLYDTAPRGILARNDQARKEFLSHILQDKSLHEALLPMSFKLPPQAFPAEHHNARIEWLAAQTEAQQIDLATSQLNHWLSAITGSLALSPTNAVILQNLLAKHAPLNIKPTLESYVTSPKHGANKTCAEVVLAGLNKRFGRVGGGLSIIDGAQDTRGGLSVSERQGESGSLSIPEE